MFFIFVLRHAVEPVTVHGRGGRNEPVAGRVAQQGAAGTGRTVRGVEPGQEKRAPDEQQQRGRKRYGRTACGETHQDGTVAAAAAANEPADDDDGEGTGATGRRQQRSGQSESQPERCSGRRSGSDWLQPSPGPELAATDRRRRCGRDRRRCHRNGHRSFRR